MSETKLEKKKLFFIYQYYLLFETNPEIFNVEIFQHKWLQNISNNEIDIQKNLKNDWLFFRLPPLEKAILILASEQLINYYNNQKKIKLILNQIINFSKAYLDQNHYKYINKVLDLILNKKQFNIKKNQNNSNPKLLLLTTKELTIKKL